MAALRAAGAALLRPRPGPAPAALGYHKKVVDHYENPRNVGSLDRNAKNVGTGLVGAPACGDVMKLQVTLGTCWHMSGVTWGCCEGQTSRVPSGDSMARASKALVRSTSKGEKLIME
ncbi:iron-sulfur cluster assembly enzyme ISCU, mitochondrial [Corvus kubaryi]|uniref:iron-sulfur cluster assembly enzyme ISCU, mitochondrial n=1 Tax=Corvus kubaryi TaxID=68294 RepID=UPI001C058884|nr:iron-sulfur cluster assembly enzyme ISCU, mitochondrial [Corvus kubaryi]